MPLKFLEPVSSAMADRLRNPIYGTFILTWLATNWSRLFLLFFSEEKAEVRVAQFWLALDWWNGLIVPVLVTAFLLLVMPWLAAVLEFTNRKVKNWRVDLRLEHREHEVDQETKLAAKEAKLTRIKNGNAEYEELVKQAESLGREKDEMATFLSTFTEIAPTADAIRETLSKPEQRHFEFVERMDAINNKIGDSMRTVPEFRGELIRTEYVDLYNNLDRLNQEIEAEKEYMLETRFT